MAYVFFEPGCIAAMNRLLRSTLHLPVMLLSFAGCFLTGCNNTVDKNQEQHAFVKKEDIKPSVVEIVTANDSINTPLLKDLLAQNKIDGNAIYQWKNHTVVFDTVTEKQALQERLAAAFPHTAIKIYDTAFYEFNRSRCGSGDEAKEWKHIVLTANLVSDTALQNEYLAYHATQFQKWPEVSKGFCNASFQRLLVYKNGRQLMLVISIPKEKTLDELNPRTTENNPRVTEWNNLMKKYQEGIQGTAPGETWVFLQPLLN